MNEPDVTEMSGADCRWAAELMGRRREIYQAYSPVFWRPAVGATPGHGRFLERLTARDGVVGLRTGHGFVIGELRRTEGFIDDYAVDEPDRWPDDGRSLLLAGWDRLHALGAATLRVVSAERDLPKNALLRSLGLVVVAAWWVKPVTPTRAPGETGEVEADGFRGVLSPAPPVYDPGGPVLLVRALDPGTSLTSVEDEAAVRGAVLAIVVDPPERTRRPDLVAAGYTIASQWYVGVPSGSGELADPG